MGICTSKATKRTSFSQESSNSQNNNFPSTSQLEARIRTVESTRNVTLGGCKARYAYMTQRGYYPDDLNKPNQDALSVNHKFANTKKDAWLSVYDGHGRYGDRCAQYAAKKLPELCSKLIDLEKLKIYRAKTENNRNNGGGGSSSSLVSQTKLSKEQIHTVCTNAHIQCNESLHRTEAIDDSLSGTTSISVYFHGPRSRITVSNVGDSRAILGQLKAPESSSLANTSSNSATSMMENNSLRAYPLSRDQTPYRRDERTRVKKCGARIMSLDQIEGYEPTNDDQGNSIDDSDHEDLELGEEIDEYGDPPRVWSPDGEYPGTAFTRSIGDSIAEDLGVNAVPEIITRELTSQDKIVVLASDGVFEFLTNQSVIDICAKFQDPLEACRAVVAEAYELWLQYEHRTDDITILVIFIDGIINPEEKLTGTKANVLNEALKQKSVRASGDTSDFDRPLRRLKQKNILKDMIGMKQLLSSVNSMNNEDTPYPTHAKTKTEMTAISNALKSNRHFRGLSEEQRKEISDILIPKIVEPGEVVIQEGDVTADYFYFVDYGDFNVLKDTDGSSADVDSTSGKSNIVYSYHGSRSTSTHPSFGELALINSKPRDSTVKASSKGHLWLLPRVYFQKIVMESNEKRMFAWMLSEAVKEANEVKDEPLFDMSFEQMEELVMESATEIMFEKGDKIFSEGDRGDSIYFIVYGTCESSQAGENRKIMKENMLLGEDIINKERSYQYSTTVTTSETTKCLKLSVRTSTDN